MTTTLSQQIKTRFQSLPDDARQVASDLMLVQEASQLVREKARLKASYEQMVQDINQRLETIERELNNRAN